MRRYIYIFFDGFIFDYNFSLSFVRNISYTRYSISASSINRVHSFQQYSLATKCFRCGNEKGPFYYKYSRAIAYLHTWIYVWNSLFALYIYMYICVWVYIYIYKPICFLCVRLGTSRIRASIWNSIWLACVKVTYVYVRMSVWMHV